MLSEDRKTIIEAEERFRHELKLKLENEAACLKAGVNHLEEEVKLGEKKFSAKLMEFLNSSVGMWFLSSVVITGGAAGLQQIQHHYETEQKNKAQLIEYQFEIGNRIQNMKYFLRHAKTVGDAKSALAGVFKSKFPLSPTLENQSLSALYFNLYQLIDGTDKDKSKRAILVVLDLEDAEVSLQSQANDQALSVADKERLSKLVADIENLHIKGIGQ
jgi:hypothetical protein